MSARVVDFNRIFVFIHTNPMYFKRAWVIADGDEPGKKCISSLKVDFKSWPEDHFLNFLKNDFEEYYPEKFKLEVERVLSMPHGLPKQKRKKLLLEKVMLWAFENREVALKEFKESAKEVIDILKEIGKHFK